MRPILLDVDGVLLDWTAGFCAYMACHGYPTVGKASQWDMLPLFPSLGDDPIVLMEHMKAFAVSGVFGALPFVKGAVEGVAHLRRVFPDSLFIAITSCGNDPVSVQLRTVNLAPFGIDHLICLPLHACKRKTYSTFRSGFVIDDAPHNLVAADDCGHDAIAFRTDWNVDHLGDHYGLHLNGWENVSQLFPLPVFEDAQ